LSLSNQILHNVVTIMCKKKEIYPVYNLPKGDGMDMNHQKHRKEY